jgi:hypothetical protein
MPPVKARGADADPMPRAEQNTNRHHLRVWIKLALETGVLDKVPRQLMLDDLTEPCDAPEYARQLLADLKDPQSSRRTLAQILADARRFRQWIEARRKDSVRLILTGRQPGDSSRRENLLKSRSIVHERPRAAREPSKPEPALDPLWDKWVDAFES